MKTTPPPIKNIAGTLFNEFMPIAMVLRQHMPPDETIEENYLARWWLAKIEAEHDHARLGPLPEHTRRTEHFNMYLHRMTGSDKRIHHNHPWPNASLVLEGEMLEHTPLGSQVRRAGDMVYRRAEELHRLELISPVCWTLFLTGNKVQEWGFQLPNGRIVKWTEVTKLGEDGVQRYCGPEMVA